jgi:hypothetical protein
MKHIKKKFQFEEILTEEIKSSLQGKGSFIAASEFSNVNIPKDHKCILLTDENKAIEAFQVKLNGKKYFIPEPDPILIYFNNAYANYRNIEETKNKLLTILNKETLSEAIINDLYNYFGLTNGFVIFLFTAIEAFFNRYIPEDYNYIINRNNRTEIYNTDQIQRFISFDDKLTKVINKISNKNFSHDFPLKYQHITNLKEFRDSIVHTKSKKDGLTPFDYLYKKALTFKFEETIHATRDFLNYYKPKFVEECNCGFDW